MCGIVGIIAKNTQIPSGLLEKATLSLAHRGPDDSGTVILRESVPTPVEIGLGNRRLAILDLSPLGHQPMQDPETGNWLAYNGELYNFRQIRSELGQTGVCFTSHTDTEVILKAYARWGPACLERFRGMFAFALWDASLHQLFLARDQMGIKPLYLAQAGSYFLFASEVRTLLGTGLVQRRIDSAGLTNYLTFGSSYDPLTLIDGIRALPAGHFGTWNCGKFAISRYWDLLAGNEAEVSPSPSDRSLSPGALKALIEESIGAQLVSDVPVGIFLSGGIDSSALVSVVSRGGVKPSTFSVVFREADYSEAQYSKAVAERFRTDHHEISVSQNDALTAIPDALRAMDLPTMDGVNTFFVSREARKAGVKVVLSGLGGDEVFAGYSSFRAVPRMERAFNLLNNLPSVVRSVAGKGYQALSPESDQNRKLASLMLDGDAVLHPYFAARMLFTPRQSTLLLKQPDEGTWNAAMTAQEDCLGRSPSLDPINRVSYLEQRCYMLNTLLRDADFMSMSQGLEVRVPLIDHKLAKAVMNVSGNKKLGGTPKKLLVEALEGSLPEEVVYRTKRGFTLPFDLWMRQELREEIEPVLAAKHVNDGPLGGILNGREVEQVWNDFLTQKTSWSRPWALFVLQRWCELHGVSA